MSLRSEEANVRDNPYSPPAATYGAHVPRDAAWAQYGGYVPLQSRMLLASVAIVLSTVTAAGLHILQIAFAGRSADTEENVIPILIVAASAMISFLCQCVAGLFYGLWIHRAASNVHAFGGYLTFTPAACVYWYFVPIAHLFKPYRAVSQLWVASHAPARLGKSTLDVWWATWLIAGLLDGASARISDASTSGTIGLGASLLMSVAAFYCISIMRAISQGQVDGAERAGISHSQLR